MTVRRPYRPVRSWFAAIALLGVAAVASAQPGGETCDIASVITPGEYSGTTAEATNDGERWRWCLVQAMEFSPARLNEVRWTLAQFWQSQFGEQTMAEWGWFFGRNQDDDTEKNRVCRPSPFSNTPADWAAMQVIGGDASLALASEPDLRAWANETPLNPVRIPADRAGDPAVVDARERLKQNIAPGRARLLELARQA